MIHVIFLIHTCVSCLLAGQSQWMVTIFSDGRQLWSSDVATGFEDYVPTNPFYYRAGQLIDSRPILSRAITRMEEGRKEGRKEGSVE